MKYTKEIYVFREAPNFKSVISKSYPPGERLFLDIHKLFNCIFKEMGDYDPSTKQMRVYDYIFICFLLGNDFLPHIPAFSLRERGMKDILETYNEVIGKYNDCFLIKEGEIEWKRVRSVLKALGEKECEGLKRRREDEKDEKYINVGEEGWEERYYRRMFNEERREEKIREISKNYQEMLTWVYKYYSEGCKNWEMKYNYRGVVLLKDIEIIENIEIEENEESKTEEEQLKYIMPNGKRYNLECLYKRYEWEYDVVFE